MHATLAVGTGDEDEDPEKKTGVKKVMSSILDKMQPLKGKSSGKENSKSRKKSPNAKRTAPTGTSKTAEDDEARMTFHRLIANINCLVNHEYMICKSMSMLCRQQL